MTKEELLSLACKTFEPDIEISWSSSHRSVSMALVAVANYQKAIAVAAELQAAIGGLTVED